MNTKTIELIGKRRTNVSSLCPPALDWAVALAEGASYDFEDGTTADDCFLEFAHTAWMLPSYSPSTNWSQGGLIVERECIALSMNMEPEHADSARWRAYSYRYGSDRTCNGATPLIAAMRCYATSKLGDMVDVPEELL